MTEEQKEKTKKAAWDYVVLVVVACALVGFLCWLYVESGRELTVEAMGAIAGVVAGIVFLGKRLGVNIVSSGTLVIAAAMLMGCGATCTTERQIVDALEVGLDAADGVVGQRGGEEYETASWIAHGVQQLGSAAVGACEVLRDGSSWTIWLLQAVEAAYAVVEIIEGANASIEETSPIELLQAIGRIEYELSR